MGSSLGRLNREGESFLKNGLSFCFELLMSIQCGEGPLGLLSRQKPRDGKKKEDRKDKCIGKQAFQRPFSNGSPTCLC